jgi:hypothetical protein
MACITHLAGRTSLPHQITSRLALLTAQGLQHRLGRFTPKDLLKIQTEANRKEFCRIRALFQGLKCGLVLWITIIIWRGPFGENYEVTSKELDLGGRGLCCIRSTVGMREAWALLRFLYGKRERDLRHLHGL